jgi:hypothetical protein
MLPGSLLDPELWASPRRHEGADGDGAVRAQKVMDQWM